jgi:EAL domain-containing protein (putative c-di-GMP-specific phosphodiesterase class I)
LDDFGVGYSSLSQLRFLPVDYLKIDGAFVVDIARDPSARQIVRALVELARALDAETIAEWVEDDVTIEVLRSLGVDFAQGFAIGRPRPVDEG